MRRDLYAVLRVLVLATLALLFVAGFVPGRLALGVRIYGLVACAVALGLALSALRSAFPPTRPLRRATRRAAADHRPPSLGRIEHEVALGVAGAFDLHFRLVPRLRSIASGLLGSRRRVDLESDPDKARTLVGPETWELVRPDRPPPEDRLARGLQAEKLQRVVESLESI